MSGLVDLSNLFGGKKWYHSMTAWGLLIYFGADDVLRQACSQGLLTIGACSIAISWSNTVGGVLTVLGLRRAPTENAKATGTH